jgi:hypothetical protein
MASIVLTLRAGHEDCVIANADEYLLKYRNDTGYLYLNYQPITPPDQVTPEDLAVTLLMNSRVGLKAYQSLLEHGNSINMTDLPDKPLELTSPEERSQVAELIARTAQLPGFAASVATKVLHKKRPKLIPVLDNQAIFGAYVNLNWPGKPAHGDSVKDKGRINQALEWIYFDLNRLENADAWKRLQAIEPARSRIELFDSIWWMYFRNKQPGK